MSETYSERFRLHSMPRAQCHLHIYISDYGTTTVDLVSYTTFVCRASLSGNRLTLECTGTYSHTTSRHINRFTTEFFGRSLYFECKDSLKKDGVAYVTNKMGEINHFKENVYGYINNTFFDWNVVKYNWRY